MCTQMNLWSTLMQEIVKWNDAIGLLAHIFNN